MLDPLARPKAQIPLLIQELDRYRVRWVMSGSTVAAVFGAELVPNDLDVVPALDIDNLCRLASLLGALQAVPACFPPPSPGLTLEQYLAWRPDPPTAKHLDHLFVTSLGMLDIPPTLTGSYDELMTDARVITMAGVQVWICDPGQMLDRLPAKARTKNMARAATYTALRERLRRDPHPDPRAVAALSGLVDLTRAIGPRPVHDHRYGSGDRTQRRIERG